MDYMGLYYVQTNIFCVLLCLVMMFVQRKFSKANTTEVRFMRQLIVTTIAYCISDIVACLCKAQTFFLARELLFLSNISYIALPLVCVMFWLGYTQYRVNKVDIWKQKNTIFMCLPLVVGIVLVALTPISHFAFTLDEHNIYHRGIGGYLVYVLCWFYLIYCEIVVGKYYMRVRKTLEQDDARVLLFFPIPIAIVSMIQTLIYGLSISQLGFMFSIFFIFLHMQYSKISTDELTGLNNRREFRHYLDSIFSNPTIEQICIFMIDVDYFKQINDTYGHVEGDVALRTVTRILKTVCGLHNKRLFLSRYGGDEFIIAGVNLEQSDIDAICNEVEEVTQKLNRERNKPYKLSISVGHAEGNPKDFTSPEILLSMADEHMYQVKRVRKQLN